VLSDNGMVFTTRFAGGHAGRDTLNGFQAELRHLGVIEKHTSIRFYPVLQLGQVSRLSWPHLLLLRTLLATQNPSFLPSMILFGSMVVPATVLTFATTGGRRRIRVSAGTVAFTAVAGGILGTVAAATLEYDTLRALGALPMLTVGLIEEASKIVVPTAVFSDRSAPQVA
jgi:hypothetical protein